MADQSNDTQSEHILSVTGAGWGWSLYRRRIGADRWEFWVKKGTMFDEHGDELDVVRERNSDPVSSWEELMRQLGTQ
jgi:hypothetical protein